VDLAVELGATASGSVCVGGVANATTAANQPWLAGAWSAGAWDQNPAARASFGLYRGNPALIYSREAY
jgi:MSHA biogenesis protein MshQ